jgi:methyl-accepting chemotaxis protein
MDDLEAQTNAALWHAFLVCGAIFLIGMGAALYFIRGISKPLADVHSTLKAVADEDVNIQIPHTSMHNESV